MSLLGDSAVVHSFVFFSTGETWISGGALSFRGGPAPYSSERWVEVVYWTRVEHTMPVMPLVNDCRP